MYTACTPANDLVEGEGDVDEGNVVEGDVGSQECTNGDKAFALAHGGLVLSTVGGDEQHHGRQGNKRKDHVCKRQGDWKRKVGAERVFAGQVEADVEAQVEEDCQGESEGTSTCGALHAASSTIHRADGR